MRIIPLKIMLFQQKSQNLINVQYQKSIGWHFSSNKLSLARHLLDTRLEKVSLPVGECLVVFICNSLALIHSVEQLVV